MDEIDPFAVSVVLVSYHTGQALFSCLETLRQERILKEILLVDNGNEGEVLARLRHWNDPRVRLITGHGNIGFAAGCQKGAAASRGKFLLFLNPDCLLASGAVTALLGALATESNPWIATVRLLEADGREQRGCRRATGSPLHFLIESLGLGVFFPRFRLNYHTHPLPETLIRVPAISGAFMLMPRTTWEASGGFDPGYFLHLEDLDLCARLRAIDGACWFLAAPACIHLKSTSAAPGWRVEFYKLAGFWRYFRRWYPHPWGGRACIWLILALGIMIRMIAKRRVRHAKG